MLSQFWSMKIQMNPHWIPEVKIEEKVGVQMESNIMLVIGKL